VRVDRDISGSATYWRSLSTRREARTAEMERRGFMNNSLSAARRSGRQVMSTTAVMPVLKLMSQLSRQ
jgi:hypothetical protein